MTPAESSVYEEVLNRVWRPPYLQRATALKEAFLDRCGRFESDHPQAEGRERAAWEDALVRGGLIRAIGPELRDPASAAVCRSLLRAQRGVFVLCRVEGVPLARDLWSMAEFVLESRDDIVQGLVESDRLSDLPPWQARLVPMPRGCIVLPGVLFHPVEARQSMERTLGVARDRELPGDVALDALLRMEHTFRTLARVKAAYAYRPEALPTRASSAG